MIRKTVRTTRSRCQDWSHSNKERFAAIYDAEQLKKCRLFLKSVVDIYMVVAGLENKKGVVVIDILQPCPTMYHKKGRSVCHFTSR